MQSTTSPADGQLNPVALAAVDSESLRRLAFLYHLGGDYVVEAAFREQTAAALRRLYNNGRKPGDEVAVNALLTILEKVDVVPDVLRLVRKYHNQNEMAFTIAAAAQSGAVEVAQCDGHCVIRRATPSQN